MYYGTTVHEALKACHDTTMRPRNALWHCHWEEVLILGFLLDTLLGEIQGVRHSTTVQNPQSTMARGGRGKSSVLCSQFINQFLQGCLLLALNQSKFLYKKDEMFEGCVEVSLLSKLYNFREMLVINMSIDTE